MLRNEEAEKYENDHQEQELDLHNISPTAVYFSAKHSPSCQKQVPKTNYLCQTLSPFPPSCFSMRNHLRSFKIHFFFNPFDKNMPKILMKIFQAIVFKIVKWKEIIWKRNSPYNTTLLQIFIFCRKFNFDFPRKLAIFWVKNSWKCCGFGLFSYWQLWFHEKVGWKTHENVGFFVKIEFLDKNLTFRIVWTHWGKHNYFVQFFNFNQSSQKCEN